MVDGYFEKGKWVTPPNGWQPTLVTMEDLDIRLSKIEDIIGRSMTYHADVGYKHNTTVIVSGVMNGQAYVNEFKIPHFRIDKVVDYLRYLEKMGIRGIVDMPMGGRI